eukprot:SAG11_NODE_1708_length_4407_cov_6.993036_6_plen_76_part_00
MLANTAFLPLRNYLQLLRRNLIARWMCHVVSGKFLLILHTAACGGFLSLPFKQFNQFGADFMKMALQAIASKHRL